MNRRAYQASNFPRAPERIWVQERSVIKEDIMATVRKNIPTKARAADVWAAIRDIGALHTRLVPGFVKDTRLEPGVRIVTFGNGTVLREPIITLDDKSMRLVWSAEGGRTTHYNASVQVFAEDGGTTKVVWIADFLPDELAAEIDAAMNAGAFAMQTRLDRFAETAGDPAKSNMDRTG
jgi:hypothetical protein